MEDTAWHIVHADDVGEFDAIPLHASASVHERTVQYTEEQRQIREWGLRILARMIVHAYLRRQDASENHPDTRAICTQQGRI